MIMGRPAPTGFYGELHAGLTSLGAVPVTALDVDGDGTDVGATIGTKDAFEFGGALGYDFGLVRAELDVAYSRARTRSLTLKTVGGVAVPADALSDVVGEGVIDTDLVDLGDVTNVAVSGNTVTFGNGPKARRLSAMANVWFDLPLGGSIQPYVGGGLGVQGTELEDEGKGTFAWQLGGGFAVPLNGRMAITADYRHLEQKGYTLADTGVDYARVGTAKSDTFRIGVRAYF